LPEKTFTKVKKMKNTPLTGLNNSESQAPPRDNAVNSVIRALTILDLLGKSPGELGITEISQELQLHKSTVYRLIATLVSSGYVQQNPQTEKYRLGIHLAELGMTVLNGLDLRQAARPFLLELLEYCDEAIHLGILEDNEVVYIDKIDVNRSLTMGSRIGGRSPAYCTGLGKALLAFIPQENLERFLTQNPALRRFTANTLVDPENLQDHLSRVRTQGYAIDDEEHELGIRCVAVPVRNHLGEVIAAISVSGPSLRMTREKMDLIIPKIIETGEGISNSLGYKKQ
jgi:IclR family KDG regulon transcriptional repressor